MAKDWEDQVPKLVEDAKKGDAHAKGILLEVFRPFLLQLAVDQISRDLQGKAAASDLVQQSFLDAHQNFESFRGATEADVASWLKQILEHNCIDLTRRFRSQKREVRREKSLEGLPAPSKEQPETNDRPDRKAVQEDEYAALERCLEKLPLEYRLVIRLRQQEDLPFSKIGNLLGRSEDAARKLWARAIERLREQMDHDENIP